MLRRQVSYFEKPGKANTNGTIQAVKDYLKDAGNTEAVIVASITGRTAERLGMELHGSSVPIICVTGHGSWEELGVRRISPMTRKKLAGLGVKVVENVPSGFSDTLDFSMARYGFTPPMWVFVEALLAVGGYGLKTAVECTLMATDGGTVRPFREVIAIGGTGQGADTAAVLRSTFSATAFSQNPKKRLVLHELLAMPRNKIFYDVIKFAGWSVKETSGSRRTPE